jgi:hypothetical protein
MINVYSLQKNRFINVKQIFRVFTSLLLIIIVLILFTVNSRLYYYPEVEVIEGNTINLHLLTQLRTLGETLKKGADKRMQQLYPEGYIFFNALYGITWCEFAEELNHSSKLYQEASIEMNRAFKNIFGKNGQSNFDNSLPLKYGAFYNGWSTYFLAKKLHATLPEKRSNFEIALFKENCENISDAIQHQTFPESYYGNSWPADVLICVASLVRHDKLFDKKYDGVVTQWLEEVKGKLDSRGLIPHSVKPSTGMPFVESRGSSQSLILSFLPEVDEGFARSQFALYKAKFMDIAVGLPAVREYPYGATGEGDIDSGPVIFEMGGAATIVGIRTMSANGSNMDATLLRNTVEALTFPLNFSAQKKYLFGSLPIVDVFITWAQSGEYLKGKNNYVNFKTWLTFHLYSLILFAIIGSILFLLWRKK